MTTQRIAAEIAAHYEHGFESGRLKKEPIGQIEFERTQSVIARFLPPPPAVVLDIGGASGIHALPLAARGYTVHLLDPVALHVEQARAASAAQSAAPLAEIHLADARSLPFDNNAADAVLLLGPLYHLIERSDRLLALREAHRVLRPRGVIIAASISRYASLIDGFSHKPTPLFDDPAFVDLMLQDLRDGQHRNPIDHLTYFTTAFFHTPEELRNEVAEAGFSLQTQVGLEGLSWAITDLPSRWADPGRRAMLLDLLERIESDPMVIAASFHTLAVGRKESP